MVKANASKRETKKWLAQVGGHTTRRGAVSVHATEHEAHSYAMAARQYGYPETIVRRA